MRRLVCLISVLVIACGEASMSPSRAIDDGVSDPPPSWSSPAASPPVEPSGAGLRFEQVNGPAGLELVALTSFSDGFVVVGCVSAGPGATLGCAEGAILTSADGRTWATAEMPGARGASLTSIAETPLGLVAAGWIASPDLTGVMAAAWRSTDGHRWERMALPNARERGFVGAAVVGDRTVLIAGQTFAGGPLPIGLEAWATTDGVTWDVNQALSNVSVKEVVTAQPGLVAVGSDCLEVCGPLPNVYVWRSLRGLGWAPDPAQAAFEGAAIDRIAAWGGALAGTGTVGFAESLRAASWLETSGEWRRFELPGGAGFRPGEIVGSQDGLIVVATRGGDGHGPGPIGAWTSGDGTTWTPMAVEGPTAETVRLAVRDGIAVALVDSRTLWMAPVAAGTDPIERPAPSPLVGADECIAAASLREILLLDPSDRVRCYGGEELSFVAWVVPREGLGGTCPAREPGWLAGCEPPLELRPEPGPEDRVFPVFLDPERSLPLDLGGSRVNVRGHFDDPRAAGCRSEELPNDPDAIRGQVLLERCRQSFVVTELTTATGS